MLIKTEVKELQHRNISPKETGGTVAGPSPWTQSIIVYFELIRTFESVSGNSQ